LTEDAFPDGLPRGLAILPNNAHCAWTVITAKRACVQTLNPVR